MSLEIRRSEPTGPVEAEAAVGRRLRLKSLVNSSLVGVALLALVLFFTIATPYFMTAVNWYHILQDVAVVAVLTVGQAFVIITAGIDLSQGSVLGLTGVVAALAMTGHQPIWLAVVLGLAVGLVVGLVNGGLITLAKLPPFIATLATMSMGVGAALIITHGEPVFGIPPAFSNFGQGGVSIFPYIALVAILLAAVFHVVLAYTRFGRFTYAIGSNALSARLSGLNVRRHLLWVYVLSGLMSAVAGLLMTAWVNSALPTAGSNYELNSIAAVVIGGGSLFGGEGTMWGSMIGALLMATLSNGTQLLGVSTYWQDVLLGLVVVLAVYVDNFRRRTTV
ncbi:MAG: ABC transporter permease [Actinomycetia bacterium]|nr:ABC transporter permease [Actinomycetes bacterium]